MWIDRVVGFQNLDWGLRFPIGVGNDCCYEVGNDSCYVFGNDCGYVVGNDDCFQGGGRDYDALVVENDVFDLGSFVGGEVWIAYFSKQEMYFARTKLNNFLKIP